MKNLRLIAAVILAMILIIAVCSVTSRADDEPILVAELGNVEESEPTIEEKFDNVIIIQTEEVKPKYEHVQRFTKCNVNAHLTPNSADVEGMITIPRGTALTGTTEESPGWFNTFYNGHNYYIFMEYILTEDEWNEYSKIPYSDQVPLTPEVQAYLYNECRDLGMKYTFALALIDQETGGQFRPDLISKTNDWGITQINKCNHHIYIDKGWITCSQDLLNIYNGIHCGLDFMNQYTSQYGCVERAYAHYNTGKPIQSNKNSRSFMKKYNKWISILGDI